MLMSKRVPKLIERYAKLNPEQRDLVEDYIDNLLDPQN
jgi:hypothetical protein